MGWVSERSSQVCASFWSPLALLMFSPDTGR
jgi:hypothetical protein